ncbi:MAG TPA: S-layer homology domain-containing protein [Thermoanaerobaculia bacterium]|nr:S-layer homology domain-containing protein [Thermoanaerobaculia bacterium]
MTTLRLVASAIALATGSIVAAAPAAAVSLNLRDVPTTDPDRAAIEFLNAHDVLYGSPDGTFRPDANVTRGEILKIVLEAAGEGHSALVAAESATTVYTDVPASHTLATYVYFASARGSIAGYGDGTFRPDAQVSRAEAAKIVANILMAPAAAPSPYSDIDGTTLKPFIERLHAANWFQPTPPLFNPNIPATRREVARMTYRAIVATNASPARVFDPTQPAPSAHASDWSAQRDGVIPFDLPAGWNWDADSMEADGVTIDAIAVGPRAIEAESDVIFAIGRIDGDSLDDLPVDDSGPEPVQRRIAVGPEAFMVTVLEYVDPATNEVGVGWLTGEGLYVAFYDQRQLPGLRGLFDRFLQHALEATAEEGILILQ